MSDLAEKSGRWTTRPDRAPTVRPIRDDIERRVQHLLNELGVPIHGWCPDRESSQLRSLGSWSARRWSGSVGACRPPALGAIAR
jgi:hypothetical protein